MEYRPARPADAVSIGRLQASNWFAEHEEPLSAPEVAEVVAGRIAAWHDRLAPGRIAGRRGGATATFVAVDGTDGVVVRGFVYAVADHDPHWGSLLGELHVHPAARRTGIARRLFGLATTWLTTHATSDDLYLLVRPENVPACHLYDSLGGHADVSVASSSGLRYHWTGLSRKAG